MLGVGFGYREGVVFGIGNWELGMRIVMKAKTIDLDCQQVLSEYTN